MIYIPRGCNNCGGDLYRPVLRKLDGQRLVNVDNPFDCSDCKRSYRRVDGQYVETMGSILKRIIGWERGI